MPLLLRDELRFVEHYTSVSLMSIEILEVVVNEKQFLAGSAESISFNLRFLKDRDEPSSILIP